MWFVDLSTCCCNHVLHREILQVVQNSLALAISQIWQTILITVNFRKILINSIFYLNVITNVRKDFSRFAKTNHKSRGTQKRICWLKFWGTPLKRGRTTDARGTKQNSWDDYVEKNWESIGKLYKVDNWYSRLGS